MYDYFWEVKDANVDDLTEFNRNVFPFCVFLNEKRQETTWINLTNCY